MLRKPLFLTVVSLVAVLALGQAKPNPKTESSAAGTRPASSPDTSSGLPPEETVNSFLQQTFGYDSSVSWRILSIKPSVVQGLAEVSVLFVNPQGQQANTFWVSADGKHALIGEVIPFGAKPFAPAQAKLKAGMNGISRGPANAPVTIVEFSDLQCPHCKEAQPVVDRLLNDEPNAHFVFQQFPLPMHNWAAKAAAYADCVGRDNNGAFWKFVQGAYDAQSNITEANADEKLTAIANQAGVNGVGIATCAAKPDTKERVDKSIALGRELDVTGTPALFINGRKISNVAGTPYELLKNLVDFAAKQ